MLLTLYCCCCCQEYTNYHFDVAPAHLEGALDRLAQFFVKPLFLVSLTCGYPGVMEGYP